jgi:hypothetical protein
MGSIANKAAPMGQSMALKAAPMGQSMAQSMAPMAQSLGQKAAPAMGNMAQKAQVAAQQAVATAAAEEAKKQMSNAFSAGLSGAKSAVGRRK